MSQFVDAVRRHGTTGVNVRIDKRRERRRRFDCGIEAEAQFAQEREVGTEAGRDDDVVDMFYDGAAAECRFDLQTLARARDAVDDEGGKQVQPALVDRLLRSEAERAATGNWSFRPPPSRRAMRSRRSAHNT